MACFSPFIVDTPHLPEQKTPVPCGRCAHCKKVRTDQWVFRLMEEDKVSTSSYFITLTYNTDHVPISENGFMTLCRKEGPKFWKRLREHASRKFPYAKPIKYYLCGEYGSQRKRPHYHAIVFNVPDPELFYDAWDKGKVDVGNVAGASIAYTVGYLAKESKIPLFERDDRVPEFSQMSKGLGKSYVDNMRQVNYHKADYTRQFVVDHQNKKIPMPKYYKDIIYSDQERAILRKISEDAIEADRLKQWTEFKRKNPKATEVDFENYLRKKVVVKSNRYYKTKKQRNVD